MREKLDKYLCLFMDPWIKHFIILIKTWVSLLYFSKLLVNHVELHDVAPSCEWAMWSFVLMFTFTVSPFRAHLCARVLTFTIFWLLKKPEPETWCGHDRLTCLEKHMAPSTDHKSHLVFKLYYVSIWWRLCETLK